MLPNAVMAHPRTLALAEILLLRGPLLLVARDGRGPVWALESA